MLFFLLCIFGEYLTFFIYFLVFFLPSQSFFYYWIFLSAKKWSIDFFFLLQKPAALVEGLFLNNFCWLSNFASIAAPCKRDVRSEYSLVHSRLEKRFSKDFIKPKFKATFHQMLSLWHHTRLWTFSSSDFWKIIKMLSPTHRGVMQIEIQAGERVGKTGYILDLRSKFEHQWFNVKHGLEAASLWFGSHSAIYFLCITTIL